MANRIDADEILKPLKKGEFYSVNKLSREFKYSRMWLYTILARPEFKKFRWEIKDYGNYCRQAYKYCDELVLMLAEHRNRIY